MHIRDLENQVGIFDVLVYLYRHQKSFLSEIRYKTNINITTLYNALKKLNGLELIREEPEVVGFGKPKRWIFLTDKGKKVAEELMKIEKIMKEK